MKNAGIETYIGDVSFLKNRGKKNPPGFIEATYPGFAEAGLVEQT